MRLRNILLGSIAVVAVAVAVLALNKPKSTLSGDVANDPALIKRGAYLAIAGDCAACHTAQGGQLYAGGLPLPIPELGTIYSRNITPDAETGIGNMTLAQFDQSVRLGVGQHGENLYPAMPYVSYAKVSDEDVKALFAFFKYGVKPVNQANKSSTIPFPLNMRWPIQLWNIGFFDRTPYQPKEGHDAAWNRGAYLAQGLAHCGTCHTPRGIALQELALDETRPKFLGGSLLAGWQAYNITSDPNSGIGLWTEDQLTQYLSSGHVSNLAQAAGPMAEAVQDSFSHMEMADIKAIASYIKTLPASDDGAKAPRQSHGQPAKVVNSVRGVAFNNDETDGGRLFVGACGSCHGPAGAGGGNGYYASLFQNSTVGASNAANLLQVVMNGVSRKVDDKITFMPAFRESALSDEQLTNIINFVTNQFGDPNVRVSVDQVKSARAQPAAK